MIPCVMYLYLDTYEKPAHECPNLLAMYESLSITSFLVRYLGFCVNSTVLETHQACENGQSMTSSLNVNSHCSK